MEKVLAVIPARGGSKGVKNKNIKLLGGIPLVAHSIRAARESEVVDKIVVSTDSDAVAQVVNIEGGAEVIRRPDELAQDHSLVIDAVRHVVTTLEKRGEAYDILLLLEPTSPLRTGGDVKSAVDLLRKPGIDSVASFSETSTPPARIWRIENGNVEPFIAGSNAFLPRQQLEKGYYINGVIYGIRIRDLKANPGTISFFFGKTAPVIIPEERIIDIDSEMDFFVAEFLIRQTKE